MFNAADFEYTAATIDDFLGDTVRFASVADFATFLKEHAFARVRQAGIGDPALLVNKATRDFWQVTSGDDGGVLITRLMDPADGSVAF